MTGQLEQVDARSGCGALLRSREPLNPDRRVRHPPQNGQIEGVRGEDLYRFVVKPGCRGGHGMDGSRPVGYTYFRYQSFLYRLDQGG
jgi:hypothetical protein